MNFLKPIDLCNFNLFTTRITNSDPPERVLFSFGSGSVPTEVTSIPLSLAMGQGVSEFEPSQIITQRILKDMAYEIPFDCTLVEFQGVEQLTVFSASVLSQLLPANIFLYRSINPTPGGGRADAVPFE